MRNCGEGQWKNLQYKRRNSFTCQTLEHTILTQVPASTSYTLSCMSCPVLHTALQTPKLGISLVECVSWPLFKSLTIYYPLLSSRLLSKFRIKECMCIWVQKRGVAMVLNGNTINLSEDICNKSLCASWANR